MGLFGPIGLTKMLSEGNLFVRRRLTVLER